MPMVGSQHYAYTPAGEAAAKRASKRSGMPMKMKSHARAMALRKRGGKGMRMPMRPDTDSDYA